MTEEEKKEFEEFLQWKAEKKKKEEKEKREQEEREKAELDKQESLVAEQAKANTQAANSSSLTNWQMRKVITISLHRKLYTLYVVS